MSWRICSTVGRTVGAPSCNAEPWACVVAPLKNEDSMANRKAPRGGRLSTGCGGCILTPRTAGRVSVVHVSPALCLTGEGKGSRLWDEMHGA
jgi:hypothetical protein